MIDEHRGAFEYDWRTRFHLPLSVVGRSMTYGEAHRLAQILAADPSSAVAASAQGWGHPISREGILLADLFDLQHRSKSKRVPKAYPRPWDPKPVRLGTAHYSVAAIRALLDKHRQEVTPDG